MTNDEIRRNDEFQRPKIGRRRFWSVGTLAFVISVFDLPSSFVIRHFPILRHFPFSSTLFKSALVLRKNAFPPTAGEAIKPLASEFVAKAWNARPGLSTVVVPSWLKK